MERLDKDQIKEDVFKFVIFINDCYGTILDDDKLKFISKNLFDYVVMLKTPNKVLENIYNEMKENYKKYLPLCLLSFITAHNNSYK